MAGSIQIALLPLGRTVRVISGATLQDALFAQGVEFPCGGRGRCKGCRVRVIAGALPVTPEDEARLSREDLAAGWRLSCRARPNSDLTLELAQWEASILSDDARVEFTPREGLGVAVDLGTTTLVAQLIDLQTGNVLAVRTALNAQARHGADIMSRIEFGMATEGAAQLNRLVREQIGGLIAELMASAPPGQSLQDVVIVGNSVMHHLFCGVSMAPLSHHPFEPVDDGWRTFAAAELGWLADSAARVHFLPCLGSFVGSDILAGILATGMHEREKPTVLVDLGTNGEIVVGNRERLVCASTAAGPAFEGARISMGMRAATGAISAVSLRDGAFACQVLGEVEPRGICGSGLVDAVACGLDLGRVRSSGRIAAGEELPLLAPVKLNQRDIRELQLAKGAIASGIRLLIQRWGTRAEDLERVYLAGAFGNYISRSSARRIGLIDFPVERVEAAGNTALRGAKLALFGLATRGDGFAGLLARTEHIPLNDDPQFHDVYVEEMTFPESG